MAVYVISGTSKGLGFEMVRQLSADSTNLVIGLVRDKAGTEKKIAAEIGDRPNVRIVHADLDNYASLKQAAADTSKIVGERGIDYLVANAAYLPHLDAYAHISKMGDKVEEIEEVANKLNKTNIIGNIHFFNLFVPLVLKGKVKKVIAITSGLGDIDFTNQTDVESSTLYGASKAALNLIVAKYSAEYKKDGVLFVSISPGTVDVGHFDNIPPEAMEGLMVFAGKVLKHAPHFKGAATVDQAVRDVIATWERASIETGYAGQFVSHFGNKQWV